LTAARIYEAAQRKLGAKGLHDPDATQWLDVTLDVDGAQYTMILSLRRWTEDLGYGLLGEMTVWNLGGGDYHEGSANRVIAKVLQRMDDFTALYVQAQVDVRRVICREYARNLDVPPAAGSFKARTLTISPGMQPCALACPCGIFGYEWRPGHRRPFFLTSPSSPRLVSPIPQKPPQIAP